jgi:RNA-binding protein YhbY
MDTTTISSAQARRLSEKWLDTVKTLKELEEQKKQIEASLKEYVTETGVKTIGNLMAYTRSSAAKLECYATNKKLDDVVPFLLSHTEIEDYVKRSLDTTGIVNDYSKNPVLKSVLQAYKVRPSEPETNIYFKHI